MTYGTHKNLHVSLFLLTIFGPIYDQAMFPRNIIVKAEEMSVFLGSSWVLITIATCIAIVCSVPPALFPTSLCGQNIGGCSSDGIGCVNSVKPRRAACTVRRESFNC